MMEVCGKAAWGHGAHFVVCMHVCRQADSGVHSVIVSSQIKFAGSSALCAS